MNEKTGSRPIPPQDYYSSQEVMNLLRISKRRLYELAGRKDDPLPLRTFPEAKRGSFCDRREAVSRTGPRTRPRDGLAGIELYCRDDAWGVAADLELLAYAGLVSRLICAAPSKSRLPSSLSGRILPTWRAPLRMSGFRGGLFFRVTSSLMKGCSMISPHK